MSERNMHTGGATSPASAVIIGGGPAGLTAAVELCQHQVPVMVLEVD
jgi:2-polyprenyl-6-methoxyphenol hydroxylase-like FAD-dependent oxidoreductase